MKEEQRRRIGKIVEELDGLPVTVPLTPELIVETLSLRLRAEELIAAIEYKIWRDSQMSKRSK